MGDSGKAYYRIGEVAALLNLPRTTISYWSIVFAGFLNPHRMASGHRRFTQEDIEAMKLIRQLMHERKMSIEGAVRYLRSAYRKSPAVYSPLCRNSKEAVRLLKAVASTLDDRSTAAKLASVIKWIENGA